MISKQTYETMKKNYGKAGSRAVRGEQTTTPRSNTNDMSRVNDSNLLGILNTGYVFVGLNLSSTHGDKGINDNVDWSNFHSGYRFQNDYKLRYALKDTKYWGSYMTDLIKDYREVDSNKVTSYIKKNPKILKENIENFKKEISYLGGNLKLVALGSKVYELLDKYLGKDYQIFPVKHYSCWIGKEKYKQEILLL